VAYYEFRMSINQNIHLFKSSGNSLENSSSRLFWLSKTLPSFCFSSAAT
jgi:hypothetical protein